MNVLVIYAHPNSNSFNHAILESFTKGLKEGGHTFEVNDLYAGNFDACFKSEDYAQFTGKSMPKEVLEEQEKVTRSDALTFIFPIWWLFSPAILKGWMDRVLSFGFAYKYAEKGMVGVLKHKKALLINTTGGPEQKYLALGRTDTIKKLFSDILKVDCGIANVEHVFFYALDMVDDETRKKYLEQVYHLGKEF